MKRRGPAGVDGGQTRLAADNGRRETDTPPKAVDEAVPGPGGDRIVI